MQAYQHQNLKLCDATEYTYNMKVYLGKERQRTEQHVTAIHATVTEPTRKIEGSDHKLYMDNFFFFSPELFNDLVKKHIYCCGIVSRTGKACHNTKNRRLQN
jgi:hypothetical protein